MVAHAHESVPRSVASAHIVFGWARERGLSAAALLADTGLSLRMLEDANGRIPAHAEVALIANITRAWGDDPLLGLALGQRYHSTVHGLFGLGAMSCRNLAQALEWGKRFSGLSFALCRPEFAIGAREAKLVLRDEHLPANVRTFIVHRDAAAIATLRRELVARPLRYRAIRARCSAPPDVTPYRDLLGVVPEFDCDENASVYAPGVLATPLRLVSAHTYAFCERACADLLAGQRDQSVSARVRGLLEGNRERMPHMDDLARKLGMTARTLRRHLAQERVSFRTLVERARLRHAEELLRVRALSLAQVAERLGFADASSFHHSFVRLAGMTPAQYRRAQRVTVSEGLHVLDDGPSL